MNEGQLGGNIYGLPPMIEDAGGRAAGTRAGGGQPDMPDFGIPKEQYDLQSTGNVAKDTADYYKKLNALDQFAKGMWLNYKIDVTKPDYSRPEAVAAAQAFAMELSNIEAHANMAKNSQRMLESSIARPETIVPESNFQQGNYYATGTPMQQSQNIGLPDFAQQAVEKHSGNVEAAQVGKENKDWEATVQQYTNLRDNAIRDGNPALARELQKGLDYMQANRNIEATTKMPSAWDRNFGLKEKTGIDEITRVVNHQKGIFTDQDTVTPSDFYKNGHYWLENNQFSGTDIGQIPYKDKNGNTHEVRATIDKTVVDPNGKDGNREVYWVFKEPDVPPMRIDNMSTKTMIGYLGAKLNKSAVDEFLAVHPEVLDKTKEPIHEKFIAPGMVQKADTVLNQKAKIADSETQAINEELKKIEKLPEDSIWPNTWFGFGKQKFETDAGEPVIIKKLGPNHYAVHNAEKIFPNADDATLQQLEDMPLEAIPTLFKKLKVKVNATGSNRTAPKPGALD